MANVDVERIKSQSRALRGGIAEGLVDPITGALADDDTQLTKFHGIYQQDDRDLRTERQAQKLEPAYQFMVRVRLPGGRLTPDQWLALSAIARDYANGDLRLTTRQTFQFHGVLKGELAPLIQSLDDALLDSLAACGDVNRNVMVSSHPRRSAAHRAVFEQAQDVATALLPKTRAYHEIWIQGERVDRAAAEPEHEPLYGERYLPRKFKMAFVVPPDNDVDAMTQDLSFIADVVAGELVGYSVYAGGGMGRSHGVDDTYPLLAQPLGYCRPEDALAVAEAVITTQRDFGNRERRQRARMKYTVETLGLQRFIGEVEKRAGVELTAVKPLALGEHADRLGWFEEGEHFGWFVPRGRITPSLRERLDVIARQMDGGELLVTGNHNLIFVDVPAALHREVESLQTSVSASEQRAMACVGFPTCGLAMAESERFLPSLLSEIETLLDEYGVSDPGVNVRVTGCPNGCARPYVAEIALVGKAPEKYQLWLGGAPNGTRLNRLALAHADLDQILEYLRPLIADWASQRGQWPRFGDYLAARETSWAV